MSDDGECMSLCRPIPLQKSVDQWISRLQDTVAETIRTDISSCIKDLDNGLPYDELVSKVSRRLIKKFYITFVFFYLVYMSSIISRIIVWMDS